jgi:hypothetical protein
MAWQRCRELVDRLPREIGVEESNIEAFILDQLLCPVNVSSRPDNFAARFHQARHQVH